MIQYKNIFNNPNMICIAQGGMYYVYEHQEDLSVSPANANMSYFMKKMNVRKRQVLIALNESAVKIQAGAMQWMSGAVKADSGVTGVGNFLGKMARGIATGESASKPRYSGTGYVMLEPTYHFLLVEDLSTWEGGMVLDDGLFLACDADTRETIVRRKNVATAVLGGEGIFNLCLQGKGHAVLESPVPREEIFEFELQDDVLKIDGNMAIAWSATLNFSVERVTKSLMGSSVAKEGFVNTYRGTGRVLMAPTLTGTLQSGRNSPEDTANPESSLVH